MKRIVVTPGYAVVNCPHCGERIEVFARRHPRRFGRISKREFRKRFWEAVSKNGHQNGCWLWTAGRNSAGYGSIHFGSKTTVAHRVAYEVFVGRIPKSMVVRHKCDTPLCVRPDHLTLGTQGENIMDAVRRGRWRPHGKSVYLTRRR